MIRRNLGRLITIVLTAGMIVGLPPRPGGAQGADPQGILELATSTETRPLLTPADLQAFLPERGQFTFPAPYNTTGVRLTNQLDCSVWYDCVNTPTGGSWRNMNNSAGSNFLYVVLGLDKSNGGIGPSLFRYDKTTGETVNLGGLFDPDDDRNWGSLDGWYFSPSLATTFYIGLDQQLTRYDILTHQTDVVFDTTAEFGDNKEIYHAQSSNDDRVHAFTLRLVNDYQPLGCGVYREDTQRFSYFPAVGTLHECQIDKSGQWLLIKEDRDNSDGEDNRIVNLYTGAETVLLRTEGAAGSSDNGFGTMVAVDATAPLPSAIRTWTFGPLATGPVVSHSLDGLPPSFTQISFANARSAALDQQYACGGVANRGNGPRANEIACVRLDGSLTTLTLAPTMTDLDALGGGAGDDLIKQPFGNLDPTGQFFLWTTNLLGSRIDAFLVKVPSERLVTTPSDTTAPVVAITAPADTATVNGATVPLTGSASDNVGVTSVQFQLDGASLGTEITTAPFAWSWDTTTTTDGVHVLTALARDAAGNFTMALPITVTVLNAPDAPQITGVTTTGIIERLATVTWHTNQLTDALVEYGPTAAYGNSTTLNPALAAAHLQTLTGLTPGTMYHYRVTSKNAQGVAATSADFTFTTMAATVISGVTASALTPTSATISWTTDLSSDSLVEFGPSIGYGNATNVDEAFVTAHAQSLYNLEPDTTYHFRVYSTTPADVVSVSADFTFTTVGAPVLSGVGASALTHTTATIGWTTDQASTTEVEYGLTAAYGSTTGADGSFVTTHGRTLGGLTAGATYHYRVSSHNVYGLTATSTDFTFTTIDPGAPVISSVGASGITGSSATIGWATDQPASSQVEYGTTTGYGTSTTLDPAAVTSHSQALGDLIAGTAYHYRVLSTNSDSQTTTSSDFTFTTVAVPVISGVGASGVTDAAATISWTTDQAGDSQVEYGPTTAYGSTTVLDAALVTSHGQNLAGLAIDTTYHYRVRSANGVGLLAVSSDLTFTTSAVPLISGVSSSGVTGTAATIGWTTDQTANSQVEYGLTTAYGTTTTLDAALVTSHSQGLTALALGTTYHFRVHSTNSVGLLATSADDTFTTGAAPVISAVTISGLTGTAATITWTTDQTTDSQVEYGLTTAYGSTTTVDAALVTSHGQNLSGLTAGTTYHFRVHSTNSVGLLATSADDTFATVATPVISAVATSNVTGTTATITWTTDQTGDSQIEYGLTTAYGNTTTLDAALVTSHGQGLTGLTLDTTYHFRVRSTNSVGLLATSADDTFTTVAAPAISAVATANVTGTAATITWATDQTSDSQVEYGLTTAYGSTTTLDAALVTSHSQDLSGLTAGTTYHFRVHSTNSVGLLATSADDTFTTVAAPAISAVATSNLTGTTATITWTTDQTADSQVEYGLTTAYGSTTTLDAALVTSHSQDLSGLTAGTTYHFRVHSTNTVGLLATSADDTFTTVAAPVVSGVGASTILDTSVTIAWTTNPAADSQVEYGLTTAYGSSTTLDATLVTAHSRELTGLTAGTTYHYRVVSANSAGQTFSGDFAVTTLTYPLISGLSVSGLSGTAATINWTTDQAANSQVEYGLTTAYGSTTALDGALVTSHSQSLSGLAAGTTYHFRVRSTNVAGLLATSGDFTVTTVAPPAIFGVGVSATTGTTATIIWTTGTAASSQVEFGVTSAYGSTTTLDATLVTSHSQAMTGLTPGALYHYRVRSANSFGSLAVSADATVTTPAVRNILVVSPHPDDDLLIAAGVTSAAVTQGANVTIVYMTNGDACCAPFGVTLGLQRETEAVNGQGVLGVAENNLLFLGYPDSYLSSIFLNYPNANQALTTSWGQSTTYGNRGLGGTDWHTHHFGSAADYNGANILLDLTSILQTYRPDDIYTLAEFDQHPDHAMTYTFVKQAIADATVADETYRPILHKSIVHSTNQSLWPETANPQTPFTEPPSLAGTSVTWATREDVYVPLAMQNPDLTVNPKARAIATHASQGGITGFLGGFLHSDEFFWKEIGAQPTPVLSVTPSPVTFGSQAVGATASLTITIANVGTAPLTIAAPLLPSAPFDVTDLPASGTVIAAGDSVTATVTFTPSALSTSNGVLVVQSDGGNAPVTLTGTGVTAPAGFLSVTPGPIAFGTTIMGTTTSRTLTIANLGSTSLTITDIDPPASPFSMDVPASGTVIAAGDSLTTTVTFAPDTTTTVTGFLVVQSSAGSVTVDLSGTGVALMAQPIPAPTAGGWQLNGAASMVGAALQLTPTLTFQRGSAYWPTAISSANFTADFDLTITGGNGADGMTFAMINATAGATALGNAGGALGFSPVSGVAVTFDTYQNGNDPSSNFVGVATGFSGTPDTLVYAATNTTIPNLQAGTHHVTVTRTGGRLKVSIDGTPYIDALVTLPDSVLVGFTAGTGGLTNQHLVTNVSILTEDPAPAAILAVLPNHIAFDDTAVATTTSSTMTITNWGNAALTITGITLPSAPFDAINPPVNGSVIVPGGSITATVTFSPTVAGLANGSLIIHTDAGDVTVTLAGTGTGGSEVRAGAGMR